MTKSVPSERPTRTLRKRGGSALVVALLTLGLLEIALRGLGLTNPVLYEADPAAGYRLQPNQRLHYWGKDIAVNAWGLRDPRPLTAKPKDRTRILVLGDSVTWGGVQIRQEELFTSRLEKVLGNAEVLNAGVNGYSVQQMVDAYRGRLKELAPDRIIVYLIPRDFERPVHVRVTGDSTAMPLVRPTWAIPEALSIARIVLGNKLGWPALVPASAVVPSDSPPPGPQCVQPNLAALLSLAAELPDKTRLLVLFTPFLNHPLNSPVPPKVAASLEEHRIAWVDLNTLVKPTPAMFLDQIHLSSEGHRVVAEVLAQLLRAENPLNAAQTQNR